MFRDCIVEWRILIEVNHMSTDQSKKVIMMLKFIYRLFYVRGFISKLVFWFVFTILLSSFLYLLLFFYIDKYYLTSAEIMLKSRNVNVISYASIILAQVFIVLLMLLFMIVFIRYVSKYYHAPIVKLKETMNKVKNEVAYLPIDLNEMKNSPDELQQTIKTFNEMLEVLQSREQILWTQSNEDPLTGIANRRYFDSNYKIIFQEMIKKEQPISIMLVDIDKFKGFNDKFGHLYGDYCLREVASVIEHSVSSYSHLLARFGGDEFIALLPHIEKHETIEVAENILARVGKLAIPAALNDEIEEFLTVSIGVGTMCPKQNESADVLIELTDNALYEAKRRGRNQVIAKKGTFNTIMMAQDMYE